MNDILKKAYDPEEFRKEGHELVDLIADYLRHCMDRKTMPILPWADANTRHRDWKAFLGEEGGFQAVHRKFLNESNHLHHPNYIGHQVVPPVPTAALSDLLAVMTNNSMAIYEMGPAAAAVERCVIEWLLGFLGWDEDANGLITSGGSLGNLTSLLAARQAVREYDVWDRGVQGDLAVMVSSESHYSVDRAVKIMGLGESGVIKLPVRNHKIRVDELPSLLRQANDEGKTVAALVGNACSTSTGIYDPLEEMGHFCEANHIWFHIDGAHGGAAVLSKKYGYLTKGMERADSVVIDFHKMMLTPSLTTAVLFRDGHNSYKAFAQKAAYLLDQAGEIPWYDGAGRTIECTKKTSGLNVYTMIKTYGSDLFSSYVDRTYDVAREFGEYVQASDDFELGATPESNIVCFRLKDLDGRPNGLVAAIREKVVQEGEYYIVQTVIDGETYFRITIMNPFTDMEVLKGLLAKIKQFGEAAP